MARAPHLLWSQSGLLPPVLFPTRRHDAGPVPALSATEGLFLTGARDGERETEEVRLRAREELKEGRERQAEGGSVGSIFSSSVA